MNTYEIIQPLEQQPDTKRYIKDIQNIFCAVTVATLILFSLNLQALEGDKPKAETTKSPQTSDFKTLNLNADGKLTPAEAAKDPVLQSGFELVDTDVNGMLDSNEYSVYVTTTTTN